MILTNLDILHQTLLPSHSLNQLLLGSLSFVVLDEAHCYFAVFGSHSANILRRLRRICSLYGARPLFIGCSATIRNPLQHFSSLTGIQRDGIKLVDHGDDGSASGQKLFVFWQSPKRKKGQNGKENAKGTKSGIGGNPSARSRKSKRKKAAKNAAAKSKYAQFAGTVSLRHHRSSPYIEAAMLFSQCILGKMRCILFVKQVIS